MKAVRDSQRGGQRSRIAITGVGAITALGPDVSTTFDRLVDGERGFRPVALFDVSTFRCKLAAEIQMLPACGMTSAAGQVLSRVELLARAAAREALDQAGIDPKQSPLGLVMGTTTSWIHEAEQLYCSPGIDVHEALGRHLVLHPQGDTGERLAAALGGIVRSATISSACSSGALAIVVGASWLELGLVDRVLVGAADALCRLTFAGFEAISALASEPCRPFDVRRSGMSLGEGAGFLLLEREADARARRADVVAFLSGWAVGSEAHHATLPEPSAETAIRLFGEAMRSAGIAPADVSYVNAHGTGTHANDAMEAHAIRVSLGPQSERTWVSSCKGQLGHTLAAAGAIEAIVCAMSLQRSVVPPTMGLVEPDPTLPLRHVRDHGIPCPMRAALSSSFGFGGNGVVLAFERSDRTAVEPLHPPSQANAVFIAASRVWHGDATKTSQVDSDGAKPSMDTIPLRNALTLLDPARSRRFDLFSALISASADWALNQTELERSETGLAIGFSYGPVERLSDFLERIVPATSRKAPPAEFPHVVPSAAAGNASVYLGLKGPTFVVADARLTSEATLMLAANLVQAGSVSAMILGTASGDDPRVRAASEALGRSSPRQPPELAAAAAAIVSESCTRCLQSDRVVQLVQVAVLREPAQAAATIVSPISPRSAAVVHYEWSAALDRAVRDTGWAEAGRIRLDAPRAAQEVAGLLALDQAIDRITRGAAEEVLIWTERDGELGIVHLRAWKRGPAIASPSPE